MRIKYGYLIMMPLGPVTISKRVPPPYLSSLISSQLLRPFHKCNEGNYLYGEKRVILFEAFRIRKGLSENKKHFNIFRNIDM